MRLLQVCNVGVMTGGTAACAWTVTRALPDCEHHVAFLSRVTAETLRQFAPAAVHAWSRVTAAAVERIGPDAILLHNTPASRVDPLPANPTVQYVHSSRGIPAPADRTVYCSAWLARCCGVALDRVDRNVLYQAVPKPANPGNADRPRGGTSLVIGRLCTPTTLKWPEALVGFYSAVASRRREVEWEFVGCPQRLQGPLEAACGGRARFHEAGWDARLRLWTWDALLYHHPTVTESFGRTAADAMRAGCVPIVDDRGGFREQIAAGAGWLCRSREEFSFAIDELADGKARLAMSRRAMAHADRHFSIARFRRDLLRVLKGNR